MARRLLLDSHTHLYPCFDVGSFLDAADRNLRRAGDQLGDRNAAKGICLTEIKVGEDVRRLLEEAPKSGWCIEELDPHWLAARRRGDTMALHIIRGRQVVTQEGIEVLGLATSIRLLDGHPVGEVIDSIRSEGGSVVIPWGFGKWLGRRGRVVRDTFHGPDGNFVYAGDNGGRCAFTLRPRLLNDAERLGIGCLPGSDPLPMQWEVGRIGSSGALVELDDLASASLREAKVVSTFARLKAPHRFALDQLLMQYRKTNRRQP